MFREFLAEEEQDWQKLIGLYYSSVSEKAKEKVESVMYNAALGRASDFSHDFQYECAWKLGKWEDLDRPKQYTISVKSGEGLRSH